MIIEFHTPYGKISEKLLDTIRKELLELSHIYKRASRAEVLLKEDITIIPSENKVCEISLAIYGDNIRVHSRTEKFEKSAKEAIKELKKMINKLRKEQNEPPDQVTSSVKV
ncbi:MAG TPA: HPF/RaiA family ribosome-associated protein [Chitinophagaceae bacterium]|nr:HPF/RaiA family ribosome-associated protein [Chitinophagaceae bacterium]